MTNFLKEIIKMIGRRHYVQNFNDVFDCDISIDEEEFFRCVVKMFSDKRTISPGSPMWRELRGKIS